MPDRPRALTTGPRRPRCEKCRLVDGRAAGLVTATVARLGSQGKMADDDLICSPPVSACDHPARRLALCAFHAQLSRRRRSARGARSGCLLRDGAAMGFEVRAVVRPRTSPSTPAANFAMASRRDGRYDCGPAVLALARGNIRAVLPDEEDHKRIIGSAAVAAMGANSLGR